MEAIRRAFFCGGLLLLGLFAPSKGLAMPVEDESCGPYIIENGILVAAPEANATVDAKAWHSFGRRIFPVGGIVEVHRTVMEASAPSDGFIPMAMGAALYELLVDQRDSYGRRVRDCAVRAVLGRIELLPTGIALRLDHYSVLGAYVGDESWVPLAKGAPVHTLFVAALNLFLTKNP